MGKITEDEFLDPNIYKNLRSAVNSSKIFAAEEPFSRRYNLTCAVIDRLENSVNFLNKHSEYPKTEDDFVIFMTFACIIVDGSKKLSECVFNKKVENVEKKYFLDAQNNKYFQIKEEDFLSDDLFFEHFRALTFAHPFDTSRKFNQYFGKQVSPSVFVNETMSRILTHVKDGIGVRFYTEKKFISDIDYGSLVVSFKNLKDYINSRYQNINEVIKCLHEEREEVYKGWMAKKIERDLEPDQMLRQIDKYLTERFMTSYGVREFYYYLTCPCTNENNKENVEKYRHAIANKISEICDAAEILDEDKISKIVSELTKAPKRMHDGAGYQLEKIYLYLDENFQYELPDACSNEEWGRIQAGEFANGFAKKWVQIDIGTMSNSEIKMLVAAACYLERKKQEKKEK